MPIKFRCVHCGQYLGISHSKAGTVVDCPTCGRSVGVPQKDGQAERVGRPSLNHDDSQLAEALREVAAIAQSSEIAIPRMPAALEGPTEGRETREVHSLPPKVIPASPLPPAERLPPPKPPKPSPTPSEAFHADSEEETLFAQVPLEQLASLADREEEEFASSPVSPAGDGPFQWTNEVPWKLWAAFVAVGFSALIAGFALGRWDRGRESSRHPRLADIDVPAYPATSSVDVLSQLGKVAFKGKVEYSEGQGSAIQPDENAWIYAFPVSESRAKIPSAWFPSENSEMPQALQALGGNAVQADDKGEFQLHLLNPGRYLLLICSGHKTRDPADAGQKQPPELLKQYFDNPAEFLGHREFHSLDLDFQGEVVELSLEPF